MTWHPPTYEVARMPGGDWVVIRSNGREEEILHRFSDVKDADAVGLAYRQAYNLGVELAALATPATPAAGEGIEPV